MRLKDSTVSVAGMHQAMLPMIMRVDSVYRRELGHELTITSACDGHHSSTSRHYIGCAIDTRTWATENGGGQLIGNDRERLFNAVLDAVGHNFYVLDEHNHFHISLKPQGRSWNNE